jgi:hypothetical protein
VTRPGSAAWWSGKVRQARRHIGARVTPAERAEVATWLSPAQLRVFDGMHVSDRRHGLDVVAWLRVDGNHDPDVLLAGLLHDAGKGNTGLVARVLYALSQAYGSWLWTLGAVLPPLAASMTRLKAHAELSAMLAASAGCSQRTVELIRHQDDPVPEDHAGQRLHLADEAS